MAKAAANTGIMPTALVAIEQGLPKPQRLIEDSLAIRMLPPGARMFVRLLHLPVLRDWLMRSTEKSNPGVWNGILCRKRYIDEKVAASRNEVEAMVSLGAGFDTRAFRLRALADMPMWEIDQRENIALKNARLREALGAIPANLKLVAVDFDRDDLGAALASQGYSAVMRTFFVWEAVTQYLTEPGVRATFDWLSRAAAGSRLAFTYVRRSFLTGQNLYDWETGYKRFVETKVWLFGMEPEECPAFLQGYGWRIVEDLGYDELARRYSGLTGRALTSSPVERIVYAEKM